MTDIPERIWACMGGPMVGLFVSGGNNGGWPEYVHADRIVALTAERDRLRKYLEAVIDEYNGHMYGPTMHTIEAARSELDKANGT